MEADATKEEVSMFNELDQECIRLRKENAGLREALREALTNAETVRTDPNGVLTYLMRIEKIARAALQGAKDSATQETPK